MRLTNISPFSKTVFPGPVWKSSIGTSLLPLGPAIRALQPAAINAGTLSPAGDPLQRLPPKEALPCICSDPISLKASRTPGQSLENFGFLFKFAPETEAPTINSFSETSSIELSSTIFFTSITRFGFLIPLLI